MSADAEEGVHSFLDLAEVFLEAKRCLLKPWDFPPQATPLPAEHFRLRNDKGRGCCCRRRKLRRAHQLTDLRRTLPRRCIDGELAYFPGNRRTRRPGSVIDHFPEH